MFFGDTTLKLKPNAPLRRSLSFTPPEDGPYTLFVTVDSHSDSCNDTIAFNTTDHSLNRDFPDQTTKLANGKTLYEYRNLALEKGKKYTFDCYLIHSDSEASDETVNMTFNFKNPAIISSFSLNQTGLDPVLADGIDNISGSYKYSLPDYVNSVDVTYTDGTVVKYTYDEASGSYTTDAPAKYTVYPLTIENPNDWSSGNNSVYFNIDGKSKSLTFTVYDNERFEYNLNTIGLNETNTVCFYRDDAKSYYKFYRFTPETSGTYNLKMNATPHDNNCRISTYYNVYHNGELVSTNYNTENIAPCIFKAGEEYIIKFFGIHKNCDKTDNSNLNTLEPQITIIKVSDDVETSKVTTVPATTIPVTTTTIATTAEVSTTGNGETSGEVVTTPVKTTDNIETTGETVTPVVTTTNGDSINGGTTSNNATNGVVPKPSTTSTSLQASSSKKPATTKVKKVKATKKSLIIKWSKVKGVSGYEIQVATDKKFKKNKKSILVKKQKTTSAKIKKLKSKKKYYVRVRTYKVVGRKKVYSSWINGKATKTK
ncbi:fibronectin type III domain-containing protein [Eubacterium ventriosum]|uniref:fibronectin type III domain-containing protein n=1 Tax=Eubacterium ventriosum TaxID=39496 RepID=UPI00241D912E|nr:fibronectin type III domain-containing protein [Eubacterium ventriosum]